MRQLPCGSVGEGDGNLGCVPTMKEAVFLSPGPHLGPHASHQGPEGLPKEENEEENVQPATADEVFFQF